MSGLRLIDNETRPGKTWPVWSDQPDHAGQVPQALAFVHGEDRFDKSEEKSC